MDDRVIIDSLLIEQLVLSPSPWKTSSSQAAYLTVTVYTDTSQAGATDDLNYSVSYSDLVKLLRKHLTKKAYPGTEEGEDTVFTAHTLAEKAAQLILFNYDPPLPGDNDSVEVIVTLPDALLHGGKLHSHIKRDRKDYTVSSLSPSSSTSFSSPSVTLRGASYHARQDSLSISDFTISTILGLRDHERLQEQPLIVDIQTWPNFDGILPDSSMAWCGRTLQETVWKSVRHNHPLLLEKFCPDIAAEVIATCKTPRVRVRLDKPKAVMWTGTTAVEVTRHRSFFPQLSTSAPSSRLASTSTASSSASASHAPAQSFSSSLLSASNASNISEADLSHTAYIAIGSNVGNKAAHINKAMKLLDDPRRLYASTPSASPILRPADGKDHTGIRFTKVEDTSLLYESEPMYYVEQDRFLNGVCKVKTSLTPVQLLGFLKSIEKHIGRRKTIEKGPREIDLDLLLYDDVVMRDEEVDLTVPHPLIAEREFVLRPLNDIAPTLVHPVQKASIADLLTKLNIQKSELRQVTPLASTSSTLPLSLESRTLIMSILNITPDSFSDGGRHFSTSDAVEAAKKQVTSGADILDIGGVSTRPGSAHVTEEEELRRVIPVIQAIRAAEITTPISVDTYRASVARQTIEAGADIINDISGGMKDPQMLSTVAELDVPFVLMHMRGEPEEVNQPKHQKYEGDDVVGGVRQELAGAVREALAAGVKRWNIILDPGIGFSKNASGNLKLLKDLPAVTGRQSMTKSAPLLLQGAATNNAELDEDSALLASFPVLVGVSRKGFLGKITSQPDPTKREYANSAVHALAIANGANIIRVHDVDAARDAARIADAIYGRK